MTSLRLSLLGRFEVRLDDHPVRPLSTDKERGLLAFLALAPPDRPVRRDPLARMFWDGFTPESARHSLRTALYNLRKALAPLDLIHATHQDVQLAVSDPAFWCDALVLQAAAEAEDASLAQVEETLALVTGDLLAGLTLPDCPAFMAWLAAQRQQCAAQIQRLEARRSALLAAQQQPRRDFLPRRLTPFFGREREIDLLASKVTNPACSLVAITGEGGIGKTRLALAVAERVQPDFPDGVWFIPLAGLDLDRDTLAAPAEPEALFEPLAAAIAARLAIQLSPSAPALTWLARSLAGRRTMLLLDNFEHLHSAAPLLIELLEAAPGLCLLVTSRHRLDLKAEYAFRLSGLPTPPLLTGPSQTSLSLEAAQRYDSVQLFAERADRRRGGFVLDEQNQEAVVQICRLVEGLPLGIELAAALADQYACAEIASAIAATVDILASGMADLAPQHRSLRAVFEYSWQLLSPSEQAALARCSVFRGGFTPEAAAAVAGASPEMLASLADKSLLRWVGEARYDMHELLRQLAEEKLLDEPGSRQKTARLHCAFYAQFLHAKEEALSDQPALMQEALREIDNLTSAWQTAVRWLDLAALRQLARGMTQLWHGQGLFQQADTRFAEAVSALRTTLNDIADPSEVQAVLGRLLYPKSAFSAQLGRLLLGVAEAQEALQLGQLLGDGLLEADSYARLAAMWYASGDLQAAEGATRRYLDLAIGLDNTRLRIMALGGLSAIMLSKGEVDAARALDEETLALALAAGRRRLSGILTANLGTVYHDLGDFHKAEDLLEQGLQIRRKVQDRAGVGTVLVYSGRLRLSLGDHEGARQRLDEARSVFDALGSLDNHAQALAYRALAALGLHALEDARRDARQALEMAAMHRTLTLTHLVMAEVQRAQGQLDLALETCRAAQAHASQLSVANALLAAQAAQASILAAQGDWPAAHAMVQQMLPLPEQISFGPVFGSIDAYLIASQVLARVDPDQAQTLLLRVHQRLLAAAGTIDDMAARHRFLYGVASHRQVMEMAAAGCVQ